MYVAGYFDTDVSVYQTTRHYFPKDFNLRTHCCESLKFHTHVLHTYAVIVNGL